MISSTTWSLTEMCKTHLNSDRQDIDPDDTASYFDGSVSHPDRLLTFVRHCELDAHYQMALAAKVQMLPLTRQLTNLAGNSWYVQGSSVEIKVVVWLNGTVSQEQNTQRRPRRA